MGMVLAHQGGWDELLFVALPLGLFAFLLFVANRKAQSQLDEEESEPDRDPDEDE
jgi:predicted MFS family arabinose efflux permease